MMQLAVSPLILVLLLLVGGPRRDARGFRAGCVSAWTTTIKDAL